jgi:hypothetical protein
MEQCDYLARPFSLNQPVYLLESCPDLSDEPPLEAYLSLLNQMDISNSSMNGIWSFKIEHMTKKTERPVPQYGEIPVSFKDG